MVGNNIFPLKKERCQQIQTVSKLETINLHYCIIFLDFYLCNKKLTLSNPLKV